MPTTNPSDVLLAHDRWATGALLDACATLDDAALDRAFEMGVGTLRKTLVHTLGAMRGWTDVLTVTPDPRPRLEEKVWPVSELIEMLPGIADEFAAGTRLGSFDDVLTPSRGGKTYSFTRGGILTHVTTHAMHHRAQCLNMLRHLGADPLPPSSVMEWMMGDGAG